MGIRLSNIFFFFYVQDFDFDVENDCEAQQYLRLQPINDCCSPRGFQEILNVSCSPTTQRTTA